MKKQLLLKHRGIFLALLSFLCVISIQAQTWTPPTFEHQSDDLSSHVGEVFYLYNVGLNAYVTYGAEYGTRSVMGPVGYPMYLRASGSNYKFEFVTSSKHNGVTYDLFDAGSGTVYTDNTTNSDWTCTYDATSKSYAVANTVALTKYLAPIYTTPYSNSANPGNGFKTGGKYYTLMDNYATNDNYAKWRFVTPKQKALLDLSNLFTYVTNNPSLGIDLTSYVAIYNNSASTTTDLTIDLTNLKNAIYVKATLSNPVEITSFAIANPSFEFKSIGSMDSWVVTAASTAGLQPQYNATFSSPSSSGSVEYYSGSGNIPAFTIQQTINSLPVGKYSLSTNLTGAVVGTTSPANIKLFAGTYNTSIPTTPTPTPAIYQLQNILTPSDGSSLNIGLQYTIGASWLAADYFKLYYYGPTGPTVNLSKSSFNLSVSPYNTTFDIVGRNLTGDITLTSPAGITLAGTYVVDNGGGTYTIQFAHANATNTVTATWDHLTTVGGNIIIGSSNSEFTNQNIAVTADVANVWNGTWSYSTSPVATDKVIINGNYNDAGFTCAKLTVNGSTTFTSDATVNGDVTLNSALALGLNTLSLTGNLSASGYTLDGTVSFQGASAQTATATALNNVVVNNAIGVTLGGNTTVNGTITFTSGNVNTDANTLTLTGATPATGSGYIVTGSTGTVAYAGSVAQTISNLNDAVYNLTVNNAAGVTLGEAETLSGTLTLTSGVLTNTNTLTLANGAIIVRSAGTLSAIPTFGTTVNVNYTGAVTTGNELPTTASYPTTLNDLTIGAAVALNAATTVNGTLTLSSNLTTGSNTLTLTKAGTPTSGSAYIVTGSSGTVEYAGSAAQTISNLNGTVFNLKVTNPNPITATVSGGITINGDLNLTNASTILAVSNNVTLNGDMSGSGYIDGGNASYSMSCSGSSQQHLSATNVYNLTINNPAGVILGRDLTFMSKTTSQNLTLQAGQFDNSTFKLTLCNNCTVVRTAGSLTTLPTFGTFVKLLYNGSSAQTTGLEVPTTASVLTNMTVSNSAGVTLNSNATVNGILTISSGAALSVAAGKQLTATTTLTNSGTLNLLSTTDGTATILTPTGAIGGVVNVQQYLTSGRNWYVSSPVAAAPITVISNASQLYSFDESTSPAGTWSSVTGNLTPLKGYVAKVDGATGTVTFTGGALNNGPISNTSIGTTLTGTAGNTYRGFNLVGNPYPSYVNWEMAYAAATNLESSIWYRTLNASTYVFDTYNAVDHIGTSNNNNSAIQVTRYIAPMQAVWVRVVAGTTGTLGFDNTMRSHQDQTIATNRLKAPAVNTQQVLRLQVSNGTNSDQAIVLFNANASDGYDVYDSPKMSNNNPAIPEIYTTAGNENVVINGLNSVKVNQELPLGFTTGQSNTFSIKATEISNFDAGTKVILKDKLLNTEQDLSVDSTYSFTSDITSTTDRFSIVFKSVGVATGLNKAGDDQALIYKNANNQITVNCKGVISSDAIVSVYNALGQKLESKQITSTTTVIGKTFTSGVYVVTVNNGGKNTTKKVILN